MHCGAVNVDWRPFREVFMIKKKIQKIMLSKETLRQLDAAELAPVAGGISGSVCGNDTCFQICRGTKFC